MKNKGQMKKYAALLADGTIVSFEAVESAYLKSADLMAARKGTKCISCVRDYREDNFRKTGTCDG